MILIGEMRDEETMETALTAAETGHLVLSTLHTLDAPETINRIIDFFPPHQQQQARAMVAGTLKGIVSQRLVPTPDGDGRVAACEILVMTGRVKDMIVDPRQTGRLGEVISEGEYYGMQTFDQSLLEHVQAGRVSMEMAMRVASSPHDFKLLVASEGKRSTSMDDVAEAAAARGTARSPTRRMTTGAATGTGTGTDTRRRPRGPRRPPSWPRYRGGLPAAGCGRTARGRGARWSLAGAERASADPPGGRRPAGLTVPRVRHDPPADRSMRRT